MSGPIKIQATNSDNSSTEKPLLGGEIPGVETNFFVVDAGASLSLRQKTGTAQILLFVNGKGSLSTDSNSFAVHETAAFFSPKNNPVSLAAKSQCSFLEILVDLKRSDGQEIKKADDFFISYSDCKPYGEAIKSPTTISRTIVPLGLLPCFTMGSVEAKGPDKVAPHAHPMLEQLFWGLNGNNCTVQADEAEAAFKAQDLMHIPLGSSHGVVAEAGGMMNYVWIDFMEDSRGEDWIREKHTDLDP